MKNNNYQLLQAGINRQFIDKAQNKWDYTYGANFVYGYGGDLELHGMKFFHLDQKIHKNDLSGALMNPQIDCNVFEANPPSWGLNNESLELL